MNADGVHWFRRAEVYHDPLRMRVFGFAGEVRIEIRIAFPKRFLIAVCDSGITVVIRLVGRVSSPWQAIAVREIDRFSERSVRGPVSALVSGIAPCTPRVPMPHLTCKLSAQPVRERPQSG